MFSNSKSIILWSCKRPNFSVPKVLKLYWFFLSHLFNQIVLVQSFSNCYSFILQYVTFWTNGHQSNVFLESFNMRPYCTGSEIPFYCLLCIEILLDQSFSDQFPFCLFGQIVLDQWFTTLIALCVLHLLTRLHFVDIFYLKVCHTHIYSLTSSLWTGR